MQEISDGALHEVLAAFERYKAGIEAHPYTDSARDTYIHRASMFSRWLEDGVWPYERRSRLRQLC